MSKGEGQPVKELSSSASAIAGGAASIVATVLTYPFDLIRTRFQVHDGKRTNIPQYRSTLSALRNIAAQEGVFGLYSGMTPALIGAGISWSMYLYGYSYVKRELTEWGAPGVAPILLGGIVAGATTAIATNPIWVIKTRMQTQILTSADKSTHYTGIFNAATRIYKEEGVLAYYRGLAPAVVACYHGAVQFLIYESVCSWVADFNGTPGAAPQPAVAFCAGGLSKIAALLSTQPLSVLKARLQEQRTIPTSESLGGGARYNGALDAFGKIWKNEGIRGFYKGVGPAMWRLALHSAMFFTLMEHTKSYLRRFDSMLHAPEASKSSS